ncbi:MAG TPA: hypothetical protein VJL08_01925 [Dehalococcoidia bacterium]|nr:hypothetical protein [Dehalococcoidia bacterium]HLE80102.1 hypothetical protein [Dehalococcoidia bacterium]
MSDDYLKRALRMSYLISLGLALTLSVGFYLVTSLTGQYSILARYGGAVWVLLLTLIIALPTLTPLMKRRYRR